jgi:hypothetical protein
MNTRKESVMATTPESFVDGLNSAFGKQMTQRSAHAKGVVVLGKFVPSAEAASVSKALHFKHEVPVTVRFSALSADSRRWCRRRGDRTRAHVLAGALACRQAINSLASCSSSEFQ